MRILLKIILPFLFVAWVLPQTMATGSSSEKTEKGTDFRTESAEEKLTLLQTYIFSDGETTPNMMWERILTAKPTRVLSTHLQHSCNRISSTGSPHNRCHGGVRYKQYHPAAPFYCRTACEYYVFALCKLLI